MCKYYEVNGKVPCCTHECDGCMFNEREEEIVEIDEILSSLEEDIDLLGDFIEERKTKSDIAKLLELLRYDSNLK